tara:strand:+ start:31 stop:807 length:777 start_codon:yes stop_codon:yes gene_type:complete
MINNKYLNLLRSQHRFDENNFIYKTIANRITDSIDLLNINIDQGLEIGINENIVFNFIKKKFSKSKIDRSDINKSKYKLNNDFNFFDIDNENLILKKNFYNLIYSNYFLHLTNNFEHNLKAIYNSLKSNGFFIAALPNKQNMYQILNSMYETDLFCYKGAYNRCNPTININDIIPILNKLKFDTPSIYLDTFLLEYSDFKKLLEDVKKMNMSYCYDDKKKKFENKNYFKSLKKIYKRNYFNDSYLLEIKVNIISAWKK